MLYIPIHSSNLCLPLKYFIGTWCKKFPINKLRDNSNHSHLDTILVSTLIICFISWYCKYQW